MKTVSGILKRLGGVGSVASDLGVPYQTVHSWIARGFPSQRCVEIRNLAKAKGVRLSVEQILSARSQDQSETGKAQATA